MWLAYRLNKKDDDAKVEDKTDSTKNEEDNAITPDKKDKSYALVIVNLSDKRTHTIENVFSYAINSANSQLLVSQSYSDGNNNQIALIELSDFNSSILIDEPGVIANKIAWHPTDNIAAFTLGNYVNDDTRRRNYTLQLYKNEKLSTIDSPNKAWVLGKTATLEWSENGERLYFENHPKLAAKVKTKEYTDEASLYDFDTIREHKGLNVWHNNDAQIKPREEQQWNEVNKNRHYSAVYHVNSQKVAQLSTPNMPEVALNPQRDVSLLGSSNIPYLEKIMYGGFFC